MPRYRDVQVSFGPPLPRVVKYLIIVTTAAFIVQYVVEARGWASPQDWFGLTPALVIHKFYIWQPFTYLFLHGTFWHILFNMFALWMFGSELAQRWGARRFLSYYFFTGVGAAIFNIIVQPSLELPTIGCSGAIYGILLAFAIYFGERTVLFALIIPMKAKWMVVIMGAIEFLSALQTGGSAISHVAHLGGMLFGYIYLRGGALPYRLQLRYHEWRRARLRKNFEVYMQDHEREKKDDAGRWIN